MSDTNLVLERLREIRTLLGEIKEDTADLKRRVTTMEIQVGNLAGTEASHYGSLSLRLDRMASDIEQIKKRLNLVEAPT